VDAGQRPVIELRPLSQRQAFAFVREHHRHHKPPVGALWQHGVQDGEGRLVGVAIVGRPVASALDDGLTVEVTRLCTDGTFNACSMLYAAARRAAVAKGYRRGLTYILDTESGASLRASGWTYLGTTRGGSWDRPSRRRHDDHPTCPKHRYGFGSWSEFPAGPCALPAPFGAMPTAGLITRDRGEPSGTRSAPHRALH
jgi:hypothetical protein